MLEIIKEAVIFYFVWQVLGYFHLKAIARYKDRHNRRFEKWCRSKKYTGPDQLENK